MQEPEHKSIYVTRDRLILVECDFFETTAKQSPIFLSRCLRWGCDTDCSASTLLKMNRCNISVISASVVQFR